MISNKSKLKKLKVMPHLEHFIEKKMKKNSIIVFANKEKEKNLLNI